MIGSLERDFQAPSKGNRKNSASDGKEDLPMDFQDICDEMKKDGVEITADSLCNYIHDFYSTLWAQLGDYPYGVVAEWLDSHPQ